MPTEREACMLLKRVVELRELVNELEIDSVEWKCDDDLRTTFAKVGVHLDRASIALALLQPMQIKH